MKYISIKVKIFVLILFVLIPLILLQYHRIRSSHNDKIESELKSSEEFAEALSTSFTNFIKELWIQEAIIGEYFIHDAHLSQDRMQAHLNRVHKNQEAVLRITWTNTDGIVIASTNPDLIGKSLIGHDYVQRIFMGEEKVLSDMVFSVMGENIPVIPVARAVRKDGKLIGIVSAVINVEGLASRLPSLDSSQGSRYGLIDRNGIIVYRSDSTEIPYERRRIPANSPAWNALKGEIVRTVREGSISDLSAPMSINYPVKDLGWVCFMTSSYDSVMKEHDQEAARDMAILAIVSLFSLLFAFIFSHSVLGSIDRLKSAANKIMLGDYSARVDTTGNDEIAATALAFDRMAEGIEQYDKLKTQFFSNLSHEFKTPLNVIFTISQLLLEQYDNTDPDEYKSEVQKYMKMTKQNCYRLLRLISNLIDITKYDGGYLKLKSGNYNIVYLVEEITLSVAKYAESKGIEIIFDTDTEEKTVACDPDFIERIILNLLSNAIKFTDEGSNILVTIYDRNDSVEISVRDTGIGIPEDKLDIIFERFRQVDSSLSRNHEGSGIGLSLVKALVEAHKGTISVKSAPGVGTEFIITLPAAQPDTYGDDAAEDHAIPANSIVERVNIEFSDIYTD